MNDQIKLRNESCTPLKWTDTIRTRENFVLLTMARFSIWIQSNRFEWHSEKANLLTIFLAAAIARIGDPHCEKRKRWKAFTEPNECERTAVSLVNLIFGGGHSPSACGQIHGPLPFLERPALSNCLHHVTRFMCTDFCSCSSPLTRRMLCNGTRSQSKFTTKMPISYDFSRCPSKQYSTFSIAYLVLWHWKTGAHPFVAIQPNGIASYHLFVFAPKQKQCSILSLFPSSWLTHKLSQL